MVSVEDKVKQIVKFVETIYTPWKTKVVEVPISDKIQYVIGVYFKEISDEYISNRDFRSLRENKETNLTREIRTRVQDYLGIKTTGLQPPDFWAPPENHMITIVVQSEK